MEWLADNWLLLVVGYLALSGWLRSRQQAKTLRMVLEHNASMTRALLALRLMHKKPEAHAALLEAEARVSSAFDKGTVEHAQEDLDHFTRKVLGSGY